MIRSASVLLTVCLSLHTFAADAPVQLPQPLALDSKQIVALAILPKPLLLLQKAEDVAKAFGGDSVQPGMLKARVGALLGDPELASLADKALMLFMFKPAAPVAEAQPPEVALLIALKAAAPLDQVLGARGLKTAFEDGILFAAKSDDVLKKAVAEKAVYHKLAASPIAADVRLFANTAALVETYASVMNAGLERIIEQVGPAMMMRGDVGDPELVAKILKLELKLLQNVLQQLSASQLDLTLSAEQLESELLVVSKSGSVAAELLSMNPKGPARSAGLIGPGSIASLFMTLDPAVLNSAWKKILEELQKEPSLAATLSDDLAKFTTQAVSLIGEDQSVAVSNLIPQDLQTALAITDEKAFMSLLEKYAAGMGEAGLFGKFYKAFGLQVTTALSKDVRQYKGVAVHRFSTSMTAAAQPQEIKQEIEFALLKNLYLASSKAEELDKIIDRAQGNLPKLAAQTKAEGVFGAGHQLYADYDIIAALKAAAAQGGNPFGALFAQLQVRDPLVAALKVGGARGQLRVKLPFAPFIEFATMMRNLMGGGRGAAPAPQPPDKAKPPGTL